MYKSKMGKLENKMMPTNKSQALVFILLILAVFGALAGGIAVMWESEIRARTSERDGLTAFYLAQAGMEHARAWAVWNSSSWIVSDWFPLAGGRYRFTAIPLSSVFSSVGQVLALDGSGNILAERRLSFMTFSSPYGWNEL